ncbi:hypothetical protein TorRG33x02_006980 [Trema orientale]|uniref:Uncharacterized protein n=1 Tax=Trema orientale TaxID=63057 RepID=A0A2P5G0B0_TREOI|nr:hypothetical protein TorRG33x02_006980 [Trema orientale]
MKVIPSLAYSIGQPSPSFLFRIKARPMVLDVLRTKPILRPLANGLWPVVFVPRKLSVVRQRVEYTTPQLNPIPIS